jgi:hypothetical protein
MNTEDMDQNEIDDLMREAAEAEEEHRGRAATTRCVHCKEKHDDCEYYDAGHIKGLMCPWCQWDVHQDPNAHLVYPARDRRVIHIGIWRHVVFENGEDKDVVVYRAGAEPLHIPYFNPAGETDDALEKKVKTYVLFA